MSNFALLDLDTALEWAAMLARWVGAKMEDIDYVCAAIAQVI